MAFGEILRNTRIQKNLTHSDVAEATHMLKQIVESLEREDIKRIAAPIYGRGFIKLYADFLGIEPEPLVRDFMALYDGTRVPEIKMKAVEEVAPAAVAPVREAKDEAASVPEKRKPVAGMAVSDEPAGDGAARPVVRDVPAPALVDAGELTPAPAASSLEEDELHEEWSEGEPNLFNTPVRRTPPSLLKVSGEKEKPTESGPRLARGKQGVPIFKIGGSMDTSFIRKESKKQATGRRLQFGQATVSWLGGIWDVLRRCVPASWPSARSLALGGLVCLALVVMIAGVRVLFSMTQRKVSDAPVAVHERVMPPPELYAD